MEKKREMKKWLPFITCSETNEYILNREIESELQEDKVRVISMIGKSKSGKTYLMRKLQELIEEENPERSDNNHFAENSIFDKGDLQETSKEKGIWICRVGSFILLDSQTVPENEKSIFMLCYLLSSTVLYNAMGAIDEYALSYLAVCFNGLRQQRTLCWVMRDFYLQIINSLGTLITPNEYLEEALCENKAKKAKNMLRREIKQNFTTKICQPLVLPSEEIPLLSNSKLRTEFKEGLKRLLSAIAIFTANVSLDGIELTRGEYFKYAQFCVDSINKKSTNYCENYHYIFEREKIVLEDINNMKKEALIKNEKIKNSIKEDIQKELSEFQRKNGKNNNSSENEDKENNILEDREDDINGNKEDKNKENKYERGKENAFYVPYLRLESAKEIEVGVWQTIIKEDKNGQLYTEYNIKVEISGVRWLLMRKWKDFCQLNSILTCMFPYLWLPSFVEPPGALRHFPDAIVIEEFRRTLELYIEQLLSISEVRNSRIFQKFIKINKQYLPLL